MLVDLEKRQFSMRRARETNGGNRRAQGGGSGNQAPKQVGDGKDWSAEVRPKATNTESRMNAIESHNSTALQ